MCTYILSASIAEKNQWGSSPYRCRCGALEQIYSPNRPCQILALIQSICENSSLTSCVCVLVSPTHPTSNRTSFISPERDFSNSARIFASSVSGEEEESYIQMVITFLLPFDKITWAEGSEAWFEEQNLWPGSPLLAWRKSSRRRNTVPNWCHDKGSPFSVLRNLIVGTNASGIFPSDRKDQVYLSMTVYWSQKEKQLLLSFWIGPPQNDAAGNYLFIFSADALYWVSSLLAIYIDLFYIYS